METKNMSVVTLTKRHRPRLDRSTLGDAIAASLDDMDDFGGGFCGVDMTSLCMADRCRVVFFVSAMSKWLAVGLDKTVWS
jgi:hypothetical protein